LLLGEELVVGGVVLVMPPAVEVLVVIGHLHQKVLADHHHHQKVLCLLAQDLIQLLLDLEVQVDIITQIVVVLDLNQYSLQ